MPGLMAIGLAGMHRSCDNMWKGEATPLEWTGIRPRREAKSIRERGRAAC